ncbi:glycerol kinase GlpK [Sulfobacillus harzensis]|uniref:Glycerol kinase n=1 Tax=Sulfobacillus harzensis TaxID=2729629 RepID=A0A7Y0Q2V2_9FIRM|nr:glycerol kinase GlpK [Sulfobacillus harzensis]NMP22937.1 glycerol kinase GlpK [Sulfobacillus harzensis]
MSLLLALDQGTTSSRAILFTERGEVVASGQRPLSQRYPEPGWLEQDPEEIWFSLWAAMQDCLGAVPNATDRIVAIGIANQRETTILWDRHTGRPVHPAIGWQCRRTIPICQKLREDGLEPVFHEKTGLVLDPYFSGTKVAWILQQRPELRRRAERGDILFGTVDTWLVYRLTGGRLHRTDVSNASRTLMFNIHDLTWDEQLLQILDIPPAMCPEVGASAGEIGEIDRQWLGRVIPVTGMAGDQQAALLGQGCLKPGMVKNTYGTGSFVLMNTGQRPVPSRHGLLTTVAWSISGDVTYALEGSVFASGAVVQWLRDELQLIGRSEEAEALARSVPDTGGVYLVPAFSGLGAPYWDEGARGIITGITRGTDRAHLVRAALEAIAYQSRDVLEAMREDSGLWVEALRVDGGAAKNGFLLQFQADILGTAVERSRNLEATAWGAALLAGMGRGLLSVDNLPAGLGFDPPFLPEMEQNIRETLYRGWKAAIDRARS